jgi:Family of unknown function (DUF5684)
MLSAFLERMAVDYTYTTYDDLYSTPEASGGMLAVFWIAYLVILLIMVVSLWKIFTKAGKPGWAALIPIYNLVVLLQMVRRPVWWVLLMLVPLVNIVVLIVVYDDVAKAFGRGVGTTLLLILLPFIGWPMLAFGSAKYTQPAARQA